MALLQPKAKKRWLKRLFWLAMMCFVVPLIKLIAFFKVRHMRAPEYKTREEWVADYLRLEYGEDADDPSSLKASDLKYLGRFDVNGSPTDYWEYPTSGKPAYATITMRADGEALSMTDDPPTGEQLS
jgi:hypothetical protein